MMSSVLFIHQDQSFLDRVHREAALFHAPEPFIATSLMQGIRVVANPDVAISGIYFDPADTTYSALRFIELTLLQRPATPLFLINRDPEVTDETYQKIIKTNHIRASFNGNEDFAKLTETLNFNPSEVLKKLKRKAAPKGEHPGYTAVPVVDFIHESHYPFNVFIVADSKRPSLFATAKSPIDPEYLIHAAGISSWLYVDDLEIGLIRTGIRETQMHFMNDEKFPSLWKTAEVLFNAKAVLNEMRRAGLNDQLVEQTLFILGDVFQMVSLMSMEKENAKLSVFMDQAKNCDRTIASATLSMLMCRTLKFDRNAVLEILGLASLLQDVSLYNSPHGDLGNAKFEDLPPNEQAYYLQHPLISADLVAQNTSVPDVALQVIRQHHERKDKTGYPNRIGGMQLHPMAEVLSLINSFIDVTGDSATLVTLANYQKLERDVFPHYSEKIVTAFKTILQMFLKSALNGRQPAA